MFYTGICIITYIYSWKCFKSQSITGVEQLIRFWQSSVEDWDIRTMNLKNESQDFENMHATDCSAMHLK